MNLRMSDAAAKALREAARRTGRSQQDLLREAVDRYLGLDRRQTPRDEAVRTGLVMPPTPYIDVDPWVTPESRTAPADAPRSTRPAEPDTGPGSHPGEPGVGADPHPGDPHPGGPDAP